MTRSTVSSRALDRRRAAASSTRSSVAVRRRTSRSRDGRRGTLQPARLAHVTIRFARRRSAAGGGDAASHSARAWRTKRCTLRRSATPRQSAGSRVRARRLITGRQSPWRDIGATRRDPRTARSRLRVSCCVRASASAISCVVSRADAVTGRRPPTDSRGSKPCRADRVDRTRAAGPGGRRADDVDHGQAGADDQPPLVVARRQRRIPWIGDERPRGPANRATRRRRPRAADCRARARTWSADIARTVVEPQAQRRVSIAGARVRSRARTASRAAGRAPRRAPQP